MNRQELDVKTLVKALPPKVQHSLYVLGSEVRHILAFRKKLDKFERLVVAVSRHVEVQQVVDRVLLLIRSKFIVFFLVIRKLLAKHVIVGVEVVNEVDERVLIRCCFGPVIGVHLWPLTLLLYVLKHLLLGNSHRANV